MDIGIKIIIAVVVILVLIGIKMVCDEKARRKRMREFDQLMGKICRS